MIYNFSKVNFSQSEFFYKKIIRRKYIFEIKTYKMYFQHCLCNLGPHPLRPLSAQCFKFYIQGNCINCTQRDTLHPSFQCTPKDEILRNHPSIDCTLRKETVKISSIHPHTYCNERNEIIKRSSIHPSIYLFHSKNNK